VTDPKIELHVHLEGTIRPATLLKIARRNGQALPADTVEGLQQLYEFTDFAHFIWVWRMTTGCLRTADDFRQVVVDYAAEAAGFGVVYLEGIFSPQEGVEWAELFTGYTEGAVEAYERHGVTVRLTPDLHRALDPERAAECARWAVRFADRGVVGLGLGGLESACPAQRYAEAFAIARDGGLALVPHAGEGAGPESIREVLGFDPARIRHGIRAVEDSGVLAEIVDRELVLDVCPTSNLRTRVVGSLAEHPLPRLRSAGVPCSISTDDPAMFGTDVGREYELAASLGVSAAEAYEAGLAGALCDADIHERLAGIGRDHYAGAAGQWRIRRELIIGAAPEVVWRFVATPALTSRWWCPPPTVTIGFEPREGGRYEERYRDDGDAYRVTGTVQAYLPWQRLAVRRETTGRFGPADLVDITLTGDRERTTVVIDHSFEQLPEHLRREAYGFYADGWSHSLRLLGDLVTADSR
jgi:aminodeoxyfutalosine deaminase